MYTCSTWYIRGGRGFAGAQRAAEQAIRSIQDQALHQISGTFKRTSRQALEVCLHVPPAELTLAKLAEEACLRIMTSPLRSTLCHVRGQAHRNDPYASPLHRLETAINCKLGRDTSQRIETIYPFVVPPRWEPPEARIDDTREEAIKAIEATSRADTTIQFFTYGSGFDNGIGAAVYSSIGQAYKPAPRASQGGLPGSISFDGSYDTWASYATTDLYGVYDYSNEKADQLAKLAAVGATRRTQENTRVARFHAPNKTTPRAARMFVSPEATRRLRNVVEGSMGARRAWAASLSDNQSANEEVVAAARGITTGLEFGVDPTTNR
ncbi:hypothetical protein TSTA_009680 [Talaromyces stipitatus ATCC 10500]|uniref:Uncharacterized protein n=1 Tax=Talaromyces stipitatus (strain ATCC 10500 / CBS 375.48 / QM 6759 / NRRL 1006) TaxID=441959 RepID=B8MFY0_TALSN|nr:uncharacterized protein TSTA_009680 [Talaromyces stipitatus ATCC 10500]EED15847.1 hypothetical protein TSTA_009680 [Talaromyces stipitatus ATCC 10500]